MTGDAWHRWIASREAIPARWIRLPAGDGRQDPRPAPAGYRVVRRGLWSMLQDYAAVAGVEDGVQLLAIQAACVRLETRGGGNCLVPGGVRRELWRACQEAQQRANRLPATLPGWTRSLRWSPPRPFRECAAVVAGAAADGLIAAIPDSRPGVTPRPGHLLLCESPAAWLAGGLASQPADGRRSGGRPDSPWSQLLAWRSWFGDRFVWLRATTSPLGPDRRRELAALYQPWFSADASAAEPY